MGAMMLVTSVTLYAEQVQFSSAALAAGEWSVTDVREIAEPVEPLVGCSIPSWAPDSSAFAFASGSQQRLIWGDIFVYEVETGGLVNLTIHAR